MTTTIYFIRHAPSDTSKWHDQNRPLTSEGEKGAQAVLEAMQDIPIDYFFSSSSPRAIDTIKPLADSHGKQIDIFDELCELRLRGKDYHLEKSNLNAEIKNVFENSEYNLPGGESRLEVEARGLPCFRHIIKDHKGKTLALGTHGIIMTLIMASYDPTFGYDFWSTTTKPDIYRVEIEGDRFVAFERILCN